MFYIILIGSGDGGGDVFEHRGTETQSLLECGGTEFFCLYEEPVTEFAKGNLMFPH